MGASREATYSAVAEPAVLAGASILNDIAAALDAQHRGPRGDLSPLGPRGLGAARRVIVTTEEIVDEEVIRNQPCRTMIPFYVVDAVCEVPHGAHPTLMPYLYFFDEDHIGEWLDVSQTTAGTADYFEKYVYSVNCFEAYLERVGGSPKLNYLKQVEQLRAPMHTPWLKTKKG